MANKRRTRKRCHPTAAKIDYQKFFGHLRKPAQASPELLLLLRSIDKRVSIAICDFIECYLQGVPKDARERQRRGDRAKTALAARIKNVRKAREGLSKIDKVDPIAMSCSSDLCRSFHPAETLHCANMLHRHEWELSAHLANAKTVYNEKRFGIPYNHFWLILLQECVELWTEREEGGRRSLRSKDFADLLLAGKEALGCSDTETDVESVHKALQHFRRNPAKQWISTVGAREQAEVFCRRVKYAPFLLGIEI
jgi:hypothetical protein